MGPESMKSVLQAAWLLNVAFGNIIVIIVAEAKAFDSQASEFFMFGIFMLLDMALFSFLAYRYKYVKDVKKETEDIQHDISVQLIESAVIKATKNTQIEKYKYPEKL